MSTININPSSPNTVTVTEDETKVVNVTALGPKGEKGDTGDQGPQGLPGNITGSYHITASGNISASGTGINYFGGDVQINNGADILLDEDQRIYFEADKQTWIESNGANLIRIVAHNSQMLLLDSQTGNRAVFGNGTKVYIGNNNNALPELASLEVEGNLWATGSNGHITASGNISSSGDLTSNNLYLDEYIYHNGEPTQTYIRITDKRFRINAGGINYLDINDNTGPPRDVTWNDGSNNVDFTIKGSSNNPLFKTDASLNRIGTHGKGSPDADFHMVVT